MTADLVRAYRLRAYGLIAFAALCYAGVVIASLSRGSGPDFRLARALGYGAITVFELGGWLAIRDGIDYHPGYKVEKGMGGWGFLLLTVSVALSLNPSTSQLTAFGWIGIVVVAKFLAFEFILQRNTVDGRRFYRTSFGVVPVPDKATLSKMAEVVAAAARHDDLTVENRELLMADLGHPTRTEIAAHARAQFEDLRRRKAVEAGLPPGGSRALEDEDDRHPPTPGIPS